MTENNTITVIVDGQEVTVPKGSNVMDACNIAQKEIPHFCYHKRLSVAGNCRMCLVEIVGGPPKPTASCAFPAGDGMEIKTNSPMVIEARKGTVGFLLANHPLDCPVCDKGGECNLQDLAVGYGSDISKFKETKRVVEDKDWGNLIKTNMTRCIHCMRCVRFATEIAGVEELGATGRGADVKVGTYVNQAVASELSGNMIDLCPVGAINSKPYTFVGRPWEMTITPAIDVMDGLGSNIEVHSRAGKVMRIVPRENEEVNQEWISNTARFSYDGLMNNRLQSPMMRLKEVAGRNSKKTNSKNKTPLSTVASRKGETTTTSWENAFNEIVSQIKSKKVIAGLAGNLHSVEDYFSFNMFMKKSLGSDNVDGREKGCKITNSNRGNYIFNSQISGIDETDCILLVGCNPRFEAPVLNARIRQNVVNKNIPIASIGADLDLTYDVLQISESAEVLDTPNLTMKKFIKQMQNAKNPMIIISGKEVLSRKDGLAILSSCQSLAEKVGVVDSSGWNGFNILQSSAGAVAAIDMGVYPDDEEGKSLDETGIRKSLKDGQLDILFIYGDLDIPVSELAKAKFIVYIGTHNSEYAQLADVVLPVATYTEKDSWWTNTEGRIQESKQAVMPPLHAKVDWKVFRALSEKLGKTKVLPFDSLGQLRKLVAEVNPYYGNEEDIPSTEWKKVIKKGKLLNRKFPNSSLNSKDSFYASNEILRASEVMAESASNGSSKIEKSA